MELKIHMGTPKGRDSMCRYCSHSQIIRGVDNQEQQFCMIGKREKIRFPVYQCSTFEDARLPSLQDMKQIAWRVETRNRGKWGFSSGEEREVSVEPPYRKEIPDDGQEGTVTKGIP